MVGSFSGGNYLNLLIIITLIKESVSATLSILGLIEILFAIIVCYNGSIIISISFKVGEFLKGWDLLLIFWETGFGRVLFEEGLSPLITSFFAIIISIVGTFYGVHSVR